MLYDSPCVAAPAYFWLPHAPPPAHRTILDDLKMKRYCCRRMFLTHVDLIDQLLEYNTAMGVRRTPAHK